jgi:anti-anti-sigma factor
MQLTDERIGNARVLKISGRLDHDSAQVFKSGLQPHMEHCKAGEDVVVLDFTGVEYVSSGAFRVLFQAHKQALAQQGAIAIAGLRPVVKEIFELGKFTRVIRCFEDVRGALAELSPSSHA